VESSNSKPWEDLEPVEAKPWEDFEPAEPEQAAQEEKTTTVGALKTLWGHLTGKSILSKEQQEKVADVKTTANKDMARSAIRFGQGVKNVSKIMPSKWYEAVLPASQAEKNVERLTEEAIQTNLKNEHLTQGQQDFADEVATTMGELFMDPTSIGRKVLSSFGGTAAKGLVKQMGGSEKAQMTAKLGTMFTVGYINPRKAQEYSRQLFSKRDAMLPENAVLEIKPPEVRKIARQIESLEKGVIKPSEEPAHKLLTDFNDKVLKNSPESVPGYAQMNKYDKQLVKRRFDMQRGKVEPVDMRQLLKFKEKVNEVRGSLWAKPELKGIESATKQRLDLLANDIEGMIDQYGKSDPSWLKAYKEANAMHHALRAGERFAKNMKDIKPTGYAGALTKSIGNRTITPLVRSSAKVIKGSAKKPTAEFFLKEALKNTPIIEATKEEENQE
jgi:hypothetical protein